MIAAAILAAGSSRRLGRPKALIRHDGEPLVARAARAALDAGCAPVVVVTGADAERVRTALGDLAVECIVNPQWDRGMGRSIACAAEAVIARSEVRALVVSVCDQPQLDASVFRRLCQAFDGTARRRVAARYEGVIGVPALFERSLFGELARLDGDRGARSVLLAEPDRLINVDWPAGAWDVDREADL